MMTINGYNLDKALYLLGPLKESGAKQGIITQVISHIWIVAQRIFNCMFGDGKWYNEEIAKGLVVTYYNDSNLHTAEFLDKITLIRNALLSGGCIDKLDIIFTTLPPNPIPPQPKGAPVEEEEPKPDPNLPKKEEPLRKRKPGTNSIEQQEALRVIRVEFCGLNIVIKHLRENLEKMAMPVKLARVELDKPYTSENGPLVKPQDVYYAEVRKLRKELPKIVKAVEDLLLQFNECSEKCKKQVDEWQCAFDKQEEFRKSIEELQKLCEEQQEVATTLAKLNKEDIENIKKLKSISKIRDEIKGLVHYTFEDENATEKILQNDIHLLRVLVYRRLRNG
ncbi:MAG: hypothetical protein P4L16_03250 [Chlamydiales bacterium]|nr:hypothetical protein [Chlamydiales bacterium]